MALQASQDFPALVERLRKQAQDPVNWTLAALAKAEAAPKPRGRGGRGGRGRGRARAQSDPAPKSRCASEAALQETTPSGQNLKRRRLQPQTSAEEWLFGQPEQQEKEEVVLADVDAAPRLQSSGIKIGKQRPIFEVWMRAFLLFCFFHRPEKANRKSYN